MTDVLNKFSILSTCYVIDENLIVISHCKFCYGGTLFFAKTLIEMRTSGLSQLNLLRNICLEVDQMVFTGSICASMIYHE